MLEIEVVPVESYDLSSDGEICLEVYPDVSLLQKEDQFIDINKPFDVNGLSISQGEDVITLENEEQLTYFKTIEKEIKDGPQNRERSSSRNP